MSDSNSIPKPSVKRKTNRAPRHLDLTGERYGKIVMLEYVGVNNNRQALWRALCDCGTEKVVLANKFRMGGHTSCGCEARNDAKGMTGMTFGRLTVIDRAPTQSKSRAYSWRVLCSCGTESVVLGTKLRIGHTRSCGCLQEDLASAMHTTHGMIDLPEYEVWRGMWQRCTNPNHISWGNYGGRGITVCERWRSFSNFMLDMGARPKDGPKMTIDRVDNDAGYSPQNCVWATYAQQVTHKRPRKDRMNLMVPHPA